MPRPNNPRFPHTCRIIRYSEVPPMVDQSNVEEDPMIDEVIPNGAQTEVLETPKTMLIYEGECRAYDKHTTSDRGDVITSYRGLALPITRDGWQEMGVIPREGDRLEVNRGGYEEYGEVIDKNPANFGGTHLIWKYGRN